MNVVESAELSTNQVNSLQQRV